MNTVLVAHYDKPIEWIKEIDSLKCNTLLYSACDIENYKYPTGISRRHCDNKGMDAGMYLQFIIDNYHDLPDKIAFVHHHETDWSHNGKMQDLVNKIDWENSPDYFSLGYGHNLMVMFPSETEGVEMVKKYWYLYEKYLPLPENMTYIMGTQFCCHKSLILQYPLDFWQSLLKWVHETDLVDYWSGRFFEYTWHYLLTKNPLEKIYKDEEIFVK